MSIPMEAAVLYDVASVESSNKRIDFRASPDGELAALARSGAFEAFEEVVRRYRNDVFGLAFHFLRNREEAWDVSQEVFIKAHRGLGRFRGDASLKTWLLRITSNHCKDYFKKRRLKTVALEDVAGSERFASGGLAPDGALEADELGKAIEEAMSGLSDKHRTAFVLRELEGLSYEDMAEVMRCSVGTVMSRLHHARKNLQGALRTMGVMEGNRDG